MGFVAKSNLIAFSVYTIIIMRFTVLLPLFLKYASYDIDLFSLLYCVHVNLCIDPDQVKATGNGLIK